MWRIDSEYPIIVPRRADDGMRDENWEKIKANVWGSSTIIESHHDDGPFNVSMARNLGIESLEDWDLVVLADADSFVAPDVFHRAVRVAAQTRRMVIPHSRWLNVELDEHELLFTEGYIQTREGRKRVTGTTSSVVVLPREVFDAVNGFDERFKGWGYEDTAFHIAVNALHQPAIHFEGDVYHLAHERPKEDTNRGSEPLAIANRSHFLRYKNAKSVYDIRAVVAENRVRL